MGTSHPFELHSNIVIWRVGPNSVKVSMSGKRVVTCLLRPAPISVAIAMPEVKKWNYNSSDATIVRNNPFLENEEQPTQNKLRNHRSARSPAAADSSVTARIRTADGSVVAKVRISKTVVSPGEDITGLLVMDEAGELECFQCLITLTHQNNRTTPENNRTVTENAGSAIVSSWSSVVLGLENVGFDLAVPANSLTTPNHEEGLWSLDFQFGLVPRMKAFEEEGGGEYWRAPTQLHHKIVKWSTPLHLVTKH